VGVEGVLRLAPAFLRLIAASIVDKVRI